MTEGRYIPPSEGRKGAAAREGIFARSRLLCAGAVMLSAALVLSLLGEGLWMTLREIVSQGIRGAFDTSANPEQAAWDALFDGAITSVPLVGGIFAAGMLVALAPALFNKRKGSTRAPLPEKWEPKGTKLVLELLASAILVLLAVRMVATGGQHLVVSSLDDLTSSIFEIGGILLSILAGAGVIFSLAGLSDLFINRSVVWKKLALNRSEARKEEGVEGAANRGGQG